MNARPWDISPISGLGDEHPDHTHAAKSRAVSQWEVVEVTLSGLYAVLAGLPRYSPAARQKYSVSLNFKDRLAELERVAFAFFIRHPDQETEGEFAWLCRLARNLSVRRNELTHSWVRPVEFSRIHQKTDTGGDKWTTQYRFFLVPPTYTSRKFDPNNQPKFIYTSIEIQNYCDEFVKLGFEIDRLATWIERPELRAYVEKPLSRGHGPCTDSRALSRRESFRLC
jgi:hypothetical protein